jgi:SAM-dependent methyltransferase
MIGTGEDTMPQADNESRSLPREAARDLRPGAEHYLAYVGPPRQYDFMGATQFRLLTALGLREHHRVLDFGCGSLRAGRLLIPYLMPGHYHGIEPNKWLVEDAIANQVGVDMVRIKQPRFDDNAGFRCDVFGTDFDFIVAQSIFSHTLRELAVRGLRNFRAALAPGGLVACTFVDAAPAPPPTNVGADGWVYPDCVGFATDEVAGMFADAGLVGVRLPWFHPRQTWYLAATEAAHLPGEDELRLLDGVVLRDPEFQASVRPR